MYLCGGSCDSIELFNPQIPMFTKAGELPSTLDCSSVFVFDGLLYMLGSGSIWKGSGKQWERIARESHQVDEDYWETPNSVSLIGNFCYFLSPERHLIRLDMRTLTETTQSVG